MSTVLIIHWSVRWLIVLVIGSGIGRFLVGWRRARAFDPIDEMLLGALQKLMVLQIFLGAALFFFTENPAGYISRRLTHAGMMLVALGIAFLPSKWKEASPRIRYKNALLCILGALAFIVAGVALFPGGWGI